MVAFRLRRFGRPDSLTLKFSAGVALFVVVTLIPVLYAFAARHYESQVELLRNAAHEHGRLIQMAFEHDMLDGNRDLIQKMAVEYAKDPVVGELMVVNRLGEVRHASDPGRLGVVLDQGSPTCTVCHDRPPAQRMESVRIEIEGGQILRSVYPLRNRPDCHQCHDPNHSINGILILDFELNQILSALTTDIRMAAVGLGLFAAFLMGCVGLAMREMVVRRLHKLETTARGIASGRFEQRVQLGGNDSVARLANQFNVMAESVSSLLEQIRARGKQFEDLMNSVDDGLLIIDRQFRVVSVNTAFARRLGRDPEELKGVSCCGVWGNIPNSCVESDAGSCVASRVFRTGTLQMSLHTRFPAPGQERYEEIFASPVTNDEGEVVQVIEVWRDITDRRSREAQIAEFHRLASLGTLASGFAHEFNTPLASILFCVEGMKRAIDSNFSKGSDTIREDIDLVLGEIQRCRNITQQFLQFSRGHSPVADLVDLHEVIDAVVPLIRPQCIERGVRFEIAENSGESFFVLANQGALQQVVLNIALNAMYASNPEGVIRFDVRRQQDKACLCIEDDGCGMSDDVRKHLFEPFFSQREGGTGLGLFVSYNLVHLWEGEIQVESEEGRGSAFHILFPLQEVSS